MKGVKMVVVPCNHDWKVIGATVKRDPMTGCLQRYLVHECVKPDCETITMSPQE